MFKFFIVFICAAGLTACMKVSKAQVLYYQPSDIALPADPKLPIYDLTDQSSPDLVIKAYVASTLALRGWNHAVRQQIEDSN